MQAHPPCRIAFVGVGALGTEVTLQVTEDRFLRSRLSQGLLIDPDRVEARNVSMSRVYSTLFQRQGEALLGRFKAHATASLLADLSPLSWTALPMEFADLSWSRLAALDLLVSCTDNALVRTEIAFTARILGLPVLDGAILGHAEASADELGGRLTWFSPAPDAACYLCGLSTERRSELLAYASTPSLGCVAPALIPMGTSPFATSSLRQTASAVVAQLRHFVTSRESGTSELPPHSFAVRLAPGSAPDQEQAHGLQRSASCPWHEAPLSLVAIDPDQIFDERLSELDRLTPSASSRLQFPWPMCMLSRCLACKTIFQEPLRLAYLRRQGRCRTCGVAHQLEPLHTVASVGHNEPVARMTPRQLGWSERQLLQLRPTLMRGVTGKEQP